ncbi:MAG: response regulator [Elusimicrobiota bacterium]|jgi:putative two-component system response regulator|nr:response regulator [Elusimicrobiota bacterium]
MSKEKILIVDDIEVNREILAEILKDSYELLQAKDGAQALQIIKENADISLILLDIMMPVMDGYETLKILKSSSKTNPIPVIIITAAGGNENEVQGLEAGASDYITKPFYPPSVLRRVETQLELRKHRLHLEKLVNLNVQKVLDMQEATVDFLASLIEYRHAESGQHVKRTRLMAKALLQRIAQSRKMDKDIAAIDINTASKAIALHDVGKIGILDEILLKNGPLSDAEFLAMKKHPAIGAKIIEEMAGLEDAKYLAMARDIALYHHERWDGKGYPEGLAANAIPFISRVMAVIDVYDALVNKRVYKPAITHEEALEIMSKGVGTQFDPAIFAIFRENLEDFRQIQQANP